MNLIPVHLGPRLTTASGALDKKCISRNWATIGLKTGGQQSLRTQREKSKVKSVGLREGNLTVGTMTEKCKELADMLHVACCLLLFAIMINRLG